MRRGEVRRGAPVTVQGSQMTRAVCSAQGSTRKVCRSGISRMSLLKLAASALSTSLLGLRVSSR